MGSEDQNLPPEKALAAARKQWQAALGELELQMTRATFDTWLRGTEVVECQGDVLTVYVRHAYAVDWLQNRLLPAIMGTLQRHAGPGVQVIFTALRPANDDAASAPWGEPAGPAGANATPKTIDGEFRREPDDLLR